jgi:DUF971 family protein
MDLAPELTEIRLDNDNKKMLTIFSDDKEFIFSYEFLRVYSPSAEVRGHTESESVLQTGKKNVGIREVEPVGHYAIQITFDDGHKTGLYTFEWLYELGLNREALWEDYLARLKEAGATRAPLPVL